MANLSRFRTVGAPDQPAPVLRRIDRYELLEAVGTGGMSVVYRGRDTALDREVAVKLMHPHLAARAESRARFSREARAVARLSHPNIVEIYDYAGDEARESYLVTEFVRGRTLRAYAEEVGFAFPEVGALVARALADALCHAHSAGVIHRDLKPENVMVCEEEGRRAVKLADFGIARILTSDERMTMTGALVGSPNHMAPEIIEGREADARSDLFSLGTLLYWLTTGKMPFAASNPTATLRRVIEGDYDDPRRISPLVSDGLAAVAARAMAGDPAARYASAAEMRDAIDAALAESGLAPPGAELDAFLRDPAAYQSALGPRLVAALLAGGEAALARGDTARALGFFNRVLAIEPENAAGSRRKASSSAPGGARPDSARAASMASRISAAEA
jgi:eukaryotic-like serine/threonine-protein kinase